MNEEKIKENGLWKEGYFAETFDPQDKEGKMRTFHMKHEQEMNFNCKKCDEKISAHNKDWHAGMCDNCFDEEHFPKDEEHEIIVDLKEIGRVCKDEEEENEIFREFLKSELFDDEEFGEIVNEVENKIDCTKCANCCKIMGVVLNDEDIEKISSDLGKDKEEFINTYLFRNDEQEWQMKQKPCPFLQDDKCSIYSIRPKLCQEFPHLHKNVPERSSQFIENAENCPIVFNVLEIMKRGDNYDNYWEEVEDSFEENMKEHMEEEKKRIEKMSPEEREKYENEMKEKTKPMIESFFLSANHYVFDDDWDWQIANGKEKSPDVERIIDVVKLREEYENNMPERYSGEIYAEDTEDIKNKDKITEDEEEEYYDVLDAIEDGLTQIAKYNKDLGLVEALRQLKSNILNGNKDLSKDALSIKFALMPELITHNYSRKEIVLCLQHFIKLIKETRNEEGKNTFTKKLLEKQEDEDDDDDIFFPFKT